MEDALRMNQEVEKDSIGRLGAPQDGEGKIGWRRPERMGQVNLGF
jgi:hypothetical protein